MFKKYVYITEVDRKVCCFPLNPQVTGFTFQGFCECYDLICITYVENSGKLHLPKFIKCVFSIEEEIKQTRVWFLKVIVQI